MHIESTQDPPPIHVYDPLHLTDQSPIPRRRQNSGNFISLDPYFTELSVSRMWLGLISGQSFKTASCREE